MVDLTLKMWLLQLYLQSLDFLWAFMDPAALPKIITKFLSNIINQSLFTRTWYIVSTKTSQLATTYVSTASKPTVTHASMVLDEESSDDDSLLKGTYMDMCIVECIRSKNYKHGLNYLYCRVTYLWGFCEHLQNLKKHQNFCSNFEFKFKMKFWK